MNNIQMINASAGSGKTYNLTNRILESIKDGLDPEALMATTFTKKAAAELRERIRVRLLQEGYADEANRISDGFIGTVNGICARLLKEYALEAGMSPAVETMPEEDSTRIFNISIDGVIEKYAKSIEPLAKRMELDGGGSGYSQRADWRDYVKRVVDLARGNRISSKALGDCALASWQAFEELLHSPSDRNLDKEMEASINVAMSGLKSIESPKKATLKVMDALKGCKSRIENGGLTWADWVRISKLKPAKDGQDEVAALTILADDVLVHPKFHKDIKQMIDGVFDCAAKALLEYEAYKKEHGLMDFADQETHILDMAQGNESFKASMRDRISRLMVDEFQDTSPIQLALFLALNELAGESVWVGDPKQAIYGFRGTDPQLMDEVVSSIGESDILHFSWRSKENLIAFTNALFSAAFHETEDEKVCLKIPPERAEKDSGGCLEEWHLPVKNNKNEAQAIAVGVRDLLRRIDGIKPGDIAVLCRTNNNCVEIAGALRVLGIRASIGQGNLMETKECRLAIDALRYMNNKRDTLALAEIIKISSEAWPDRDWLSELMENPEAAKEKWHKEALLDALNEGRNHIRHWTPLEALEEAISRVGLLKTVKSWPDPEKAISNLDALRGICGEYIDLCSTRRSAATIDGFVTHLGESDIEQAKGIGEGTVNLVTYHGSKGLEWPWLVLTGLDAEAKASVFGADIEASGKFDSANPLANRSIRFWPWPFGSQKGYGLLDERIDALEIKRQIIDKAEREKRRLLYVGMTRAENGLAMAFRDDGSKIKTGWIDAMRDENGNRLINWDSEIGEKTINVGKESIEILAYQYMPEDAETFEAESRKAEFFPKLSRISINHPAARLSPSLLQNNSNCEERSWSLVHDFESRIKINGKAEMDKLGNAVHAYFAAEYKVKAEEERPKLAKDIVENWGMEEFIGYTDLVGAGDRLNGFLDEKYPGGKAFREWPMFMKNDKGQVIQGWIDMLIETKEGYVIIDHKDYPGTDVLERAEKYNPQLLAYKEAVEKSTGRPVVDILLHFPISGFILKLN